MLIIDTNVRAANASTQYMGHPINSIAKFNRTHLTASDNGLYEHTGDLDDTDAIDAHFVTAIMDFGVNNDKRLRYVYLSLESSGNLNLIINTEKVSAITYVVPIDTTIGQQDVRITVSRALHGRFWTFQINNAIDGADFSIDEIKVLPIARTWEH